MLPHIENDNCASTQASIDEAVQTIIFVVFQKDRLSDGGVESAWQIVRSLKNYLPIVVTQTDNSRTAKWKKAGVSVVVESLAVNINVSILRHSLGNFGKGIASLVRFNHRVFRLVRENGSRVVYANDIHALFFSAFGARLAGAHVLWAIRDTQPKGKPFGLKWKIGSLLSRRIIVLSNEMKKEVVSRRVCAERKCRVVYSAALQSLPALPLKKNKLLIGFVGAVCPKKGQLDFLEKCSREILHSISEAELWFAGDVLRQDQDYAERCYDIVRRYRLFSRVKFCGFVSEIARFYNSCSLVVSASTHEGLPRAMIEALSCGVPVVSFSTCSASEILEQNKCGVVVSQNDYAALAAEIIKLCRNVETRESLALNALETSARLFSPVRVGEKIESIIDELEAG